MKLLIRSFIYVFGKYLMSNFYIARIMLSFGNIRKKSFVLERFKVLWE